MSSKSRWFLDDGVKLVRALQGNCKKYGYHITLGGSVLNVGSSDKDLDLYFHPYNDPDIREDSEGLVEWLISLWGAAKSLNPYGAEPVEAPTKFAPPPLDGLVGFRARPAQNNFYDLTTTHIDGMDKPIAKKKAYPSIYKLKLKFLRVTGDRIDVFIL
jgi:hypothetical protein